MAVVKLNLKWRNKFSGEEGYVASVSKAKGYFINTFDKAEAKKYASEAAAQKDLATLEALGEFVNNEFSTEAV
ncbi:MAG: hypothetical protein IKK59_02845 [Lachnospiraceae bacterium]|nr:hypothetical protein [Lachnospiraceae bacterium]